MPRRLPTDTRRRHCAKSEALGVAAGTGVILVAMIGLAVGAVVLGIIKRDSSGEVDLTAWLAIELIGGALVGLAAGWICSRIALGSDRALWILAGLSLTFGMLESLEILRAASAGSVVADRALTVAAPFVIALAVLVGGRPSLRGVSIRRGGPFGGAILIPAILIAIGVLSANVIPRVEAGTEQRVLAAAFATDMTIAVPALMYLLFVRSKRAPLLVLAPTVVIGLVVATVALPREHHGVLSFLRYALIPAEVALLAYLVVLARRQFEAGATNNDDFVTRLRTTARKAFGARLPADVMTTEASVLYYALSPRLKTKLADGFTVYRETGYARLLAMLSVIVVIETVGVHLLVSQWSQVSAWILTGLSLYAIVWLLGDFRAMHFRPIRIIGSQLHLRVGLRWEASIPLLDIGGASRSLPPNSKPDRSALVLRIAGATNVRLVFTRPIKFIGPYGISRRVTSLHLHVDDADAFCDQLRVASGRLDAAPAPVQ